MLFALREVRAAMIASRRLPRTSARAARWSPRRVSLARAPLGAADRRAIDHGDVPTPTVGQASFSAADGADSDVDRPGVGQVTIDGKPVDRHGGAVAGTTAATVDRRRILAIDTSDSMAGIGSPPPRRPPSPSSTPSRGRLASASSPSTRTAELVEAPTMTTQAMRSAIDGLEAHARQHGAVRRRASRPTRRPGNDGQRADPAAQRRRGRAATPRRGEPPPAARRRSASSSTRSTSSRSSSRTRRRSTRLAAPARARSSRSDPRPTLTQRFAAARPTTLANQLSSRSRPGRRPPSRGPLAVSGDAGGTTSPTSVSSPSPAASAPLAEQSRRRVRRTRSASIGHLTARQVALARRWSPSSSACWYCSPSGLTRASRSGGSDVSDAAVDLHPRRRQRPSSEPRRPTALGSSQVARLGGRARRQGRRSNRDFEDLLERRLEAAGSR